MSLWFQGAQQSTYSPEESRTTGFGQVRKAEALLGRQEPGRLPSAATGDIQYDFTTDLSSADPPGNSFNFDVLQNNANFDYNNTTNVDVTINKINRVINRFEEIINNLNQTINNQITNYFGSLGGFTGQQTVIRNVAFVSGALRFYTTTFTYTHGVLTAVDVNATPINISTTTCP